MHKQPVGANLTPLFRYGEISETIKTESSEFPCAHAREQPELSESLRVGEICDAMKKGCNSDKSEVSRARMRKAPCITQGALYPAISAVLKKGKFDGADAVRFIGPLRFAVRFSGHLQRDARFADPPPFPPLPTNWRGRAALRTLRASCVTGL